MEKKSEATKKNKDKTRKKENKKARSFVWYGVNYCQEPPEYTEAWAITKRILDRLQNEAADIGAELFVFSVPALQEVVPEELKKVSRRRVPNPELICLEETPAYSRLTGVLSELSIGYVDLLPSFRKNIRDEGVELFRHSDEHWNEQGHNLAARIVYSAIKEKIQK